MDGELDKGPYWSGKSKLTETIDSVYPRSGQKKEKVHKYGAGPFSNQYPPNLPSSTYSKYDELKRANEWDLLVKKLGLVYTRMTDSWIDPETDIRYSKHTPEERIVSNRDTMLGHACVWCGQSFKTVLLLDNHEEECND